eukprot:6204545-Pleurochrysis_carterae.AAC.5
MLEIRLCACLDAARLKSGDRKACSVIDQSSWQKKATEREVGGIADVYGAEIATRRRQLKFNPNLPERTRVGETELTQIGTARAPGILKMQPATK